MNAFSLDGRFAPLTVTDRVVAEPPAFGVALAHVWPSSLSPDEIGEAVDAARVGGRGARGARGADLHAGRRRRARRSRRRAGGAARRRPRRRAVRGGARRRPERARAERRRSASRSTRSGCARSRAAGGACVRFLVPEPGVLTEVAGRRRGARPSTGSSGCASTRSRARCWGRSAAAPTASGPCWRSARRATRRSSALAGRPTAYASSPMPPKLSSKRPERSTFLGFQPPAVGDEEIAAVAEAIRSGWLTTGPRAEELERRFAAYVGAKHALAVSSGTAAMHLSLVALGIGARRRGDHDADHVARDGERDRPHRRDARLRRRPRLRPEHRSRSRRRARHAPDEGDHAGTPVRPAGRPRPALGARPARGRGRRPCRRERVPRPQDRWLCRTRPASRCTRRSRSPPAKAGS